MDTVIERAKAWLKMCDDVDAGRAYSCDIIRELLAVVERASRDPSLPGWMDTVASGTPCCECGCECIEFSRPSEEWNATMRPDGHETDREYLCAPCYMNHLASRAERAESALAASESKLATLAEECRACLRNDPAYGDDAAHQIGILAAEVDRLRESLQFYADRGNWVDIDESKRGRKQYQGSRMSFDSGHTARLAIEGEIA